MSVTELGVFLVRVLVLICVSLLGAFIGYVAGIGLLLATIDLPIGNSPWGSPMLGATLGAGFAVWLVYRPRRDS